jgi:hypothetical protein
VKPLAVAPDTERAIVDLLTADLAAHGQDVTVGVIIPTEWTTATKPHVQVALDGTPDVRYPHLAAATIRVTAWAAATTMAKTLAALCEGLLLSYTGGGSVASIRPLTGILPTRDPDTGAQLASITVRVNGRFTILT